MPESTDKTPQTEIPDTADFSGKSVFVTGATGFVGSHFVERLLAAGATDVRCLVRSEPRFLEGLPVKRVRGTLFDTDVLASALSGVDYIVHIGAVTRARSWDVFKRQNVEATTALLDAALRAAPDVERILITSTLAVIGRGVGGIATESDPMEPVSMYGRSKAEMEKRVREYSDKLPIAVVRPPAVYGPRESDIYTFFKTLQYGICPVIGGGKEPDVSLVHVDDLVRGMTQALFSPASTGNTYFLGSAEPYSWHEIRDASATALGRRVITLPVPDSLITVVGAVSEAVGNLTGSYPPLNREKAEEIRFACTMCDSSLAASHFGYSPDTGLWTGIKRTIDWYRAENWLR